MIQCIENPFDIKEDATDFPNIFDLTDLEAVSDDVQEILSHQSHNDRNLAIGL